MPAHGQRPYSPFELTWLNREPGRPAFLISTLPSSDLHFRTYSSDTSSLILFFWFIFISLFSSTPERLSRDHRFVRFLFVRGMDDLLASNARSRNEGKKERCTKREKRSLRSKGKRRFERWRMAVEEPSNFPKGNERADLFIQPHAFRANFSHRYRGLLPKTA